MKLKINNLKETLKNLFLKGLFSKEALAPSSQFTERLGDSFFPPFLLLDFYYRRLAWHPSRRPASARCNNFSISLGFCILGGGFSVTFAAVAG